MTQLLISVTNIAEAKIALENGADIIDMKDPSVGALGALPIAVITSIVTFVNKQKLTSATIGDQPMQPDLLVQRVAEVAKTNVDFIKIGFSEASNYQPCLDALQCDTQTGVKLIAVLFAEYTYPSNIIVTIKNAGFIGVMIDTANKNGLTLMDYHSESYVKNLSQNVLELGLSFGLAGSLKIQHIETLKKFNATYMGFRGGVCEANHRKLCLNIDKIIAIRKTL
jgi:(5-formylfuran-3-yl)methyl phosphate synthase